MNVCLYIGMHRDCAFGRGCRNRVVVAQHKDCLVRLDCKNLFVVWSETNTRIVLLQLNTKRIVRLQYKDSVVEAQNKDCVFGHECNNRVVVAEHKDCVV